MTVEELRREAKVLGYSIVPIVRTEKLLPCVCGCKRRDHWVTYVKGTRLQVLKCSKCGRSECGALITFWDMIWGDCYDGIALKIGLSMMAISMAMGLALLVVILLAEEIT